MSTTINNVAQLRGNIDLSSYEVRNNNLQQLGFFENICRKIADCVSSAFSSEARYTIASRNAEVARKVASIMLLNVTNADAPRDLAPAQRVTHQGIEALKTKLNNMNVGAPQRQAITAFLENLHQQVDHADAATIQSFSDGLESLEKLIFTRCEGYSSTELNKSFGNRFKTLSMNSSPAIIGARLQDAFAAGVTLSLEGVNVDADTGEDAILGQLKNFLGDDFDTCVPILTDCCMPEKAELWAARDIPKSTGDWNARDLLSVGIFTNLDKLAVNVTKGDDGYTVTLHGDVTFESRFTDDQDIGLLQCIKQDFTATFNLDQKNINMLSNIMSQPNTYERMMAENLSQQRGENMGAHVTLNHKLS